MRAIPEQLAEKLPDERIRTGTPVQSITEGEVILESGERPTSPALVLATEGPETARLLVTPESVASRGELCLYFSAKEPPIAEPYLILNGDDSGWVNSVTIPSVVAPSYAPDDLNLISVVVIGHFDADDSTAETVVRRELNGWFGPVVGKWQHLKTYHIRHALPIQSLPMPDPTVSSTLGKPGIYVCGEHGSVPEIQWALLSGRQAAEQVLKYLDTHWS